jgi:hypothetical protein
MNIVYVIMPLSLDILRMVTNLILPKTLFCFRTSYIIFWGLQQLTLKVIVVQYTNFRMLSTPITTLIKRCL